MSSASPAPALGPAAWQRVARFAAFAVALGALGYWFSAGAHRGWSQNRVPVKQVDEVTQVEYVTYEDRFVPGVDVLLAAAGLTGVLLVAGFWPRRRRASAS